MIIRPLNKSYKPKGCTVATADLLRAVDVFAALLNDVRRSIVLDDVDAPVPALATSARRLPILLTVVDGGFVPDDDTTETTNV